MPGASASAPRVLCTGIIVLDEVFRVEEFPRYDGKVEAQEFFVVNGGCAANAAVAVARLGGRALLAGPLGGPAGKDDNGDRVMAALAREQVDTTACQRVDGLSTALSAIFIDARGDRTIVTYRDKRIAAVTRASRSCFPASPISCSPTTGCRNSCGRSARRRGARNSASCWTPTRRPSRTIRCSASPRM
jgi:sugar/nucleoside kinase (ribokinase family)